MKTFLVEQVGYVQLEASRRFLVEVPDDVTKEEVQELVEEAEESLPDDKDMAWKDDADRRWNGHDVEIESTGVLDPDAVSEEHTQRLKVIRLGDGQPVRAALSPEQKAAYIRDDGRHCPFCDSENISASGRDDDEVMYCEECERSWCDEYTLTDVIELDD